MTNQAHIDQLAANLTKWKDAYYNGNPLVSDAVYDAAEDELRRLDPKHPVLLTIGAPVASGPMAGGGWPKAKHTIPMTSLNKANTLSDMQGWVAGCGTIPQGKPYVIMPKFDGASISLHYFKRRLAQAVTRGDGLVGEDVTPNILLAKGAVKMLPPTMPDGTPTPDNVWVRGEVIITHDDFKIHFPGESNPRNSANGTMKRQSDNAKCAYLTIMPYNLMPNGVTMPSRSQELEFLATLGFQSYEWFQVASLAEGDKVYQDFVASKRKAIGFEIDGLVFDVDDSKVREDLGDLNGKPKGSVAWKFPNEHKETILRDILWQVGNSGRITPVAIFDEVVLLGSRVSRASLAGVRQVEHLKLFPGCKILVTKRNDVIPRLEANLDEGIVNDL
jgi:DNA ligase (NAD+)